MHPDLKKMVELSTKANEDEADIRKSVLEGTYSLETVSEEICNRCTEIVKLRSTIQKLKHADIEQGEPDNDSERVVYDPVAREFFEVLEGDEMTYKKRFFSLVVEHSSIADSSLTIESMVKTLNEPSLKEDLLRGAVLYHLVKKEPGATWVDELEELIERTPEIDFYPTLNEVFHEFVRRRQWHCAYTIMDDFFLFPGCAERLDISSLNKEESEHLLLENMHDDWIIDCNALHILDDQSMLTKERIDSQIKKCRRCRMTISHLLK